MAERHAIPAAMKREVRQACGFGCVICGAPIFQYDHIVDFAEVRVHEVHNLALLCSIHHQDKTCNRLPREVVRLARANPINLTAPRTAPHRWFLAGRRVLLEAGGSSFGYTFDSDDDEFRAIVLGDTTVLGIRRRGEHLLLNIRLQDKSGSEVLRVEDGEVTVDTGVGDFELVGPKITIRDKAKNPVIEMKLTAAGVRIIRGQSFMHNLGIVIDNARLELFPGRGGLGNLHVDECKIGIWVQYPSAANEPTFCVPA